MKVIRSLKVYESWKTNCAINGFNRSSCHQWYYDTYYFSSSKEAGDNLQPMLDQKRTQIRMALSNLKLIIIDEISMVSNTTWLPIHQQPKEIFVTPNNQLFAGLSIIVIGGLIWLIQKSCWQLMPSLVSFSNDRVNRNNETKKWSTITK